MIKLFLMYFSTLMVISSAYIIDYGPVVKATKGNLTFSRFKIAKDRDYN